MEKEAIISLLSSRTRLHKIKKQCEGIGSFSLLAPTPVEVHTTTFSNFKMNKKRGTWGPRGPRQKGNGSENGREYSLVPVPKDLAVAEKA